MTVKLAKAVVQYAVISYTPGPDIAGGFDVL